jgi:hypothetical protein
MTTEAIPPLRQRMIEDMNARPHSRLPAVRRFSETIS